MSTLTAISGSTFGSVLRNKISTFCNCKASSCCCLFNLGPKYFNRCRFVVEQEGILYYILCINCFKEAYLNLFLANNLSLYLASTKGRARSRCYANNGAIQKVDYKFTVGSLNVSNMLCSYCRSNCFNSYSWVKFISSCSTRLRGCFSQSKFTAKSNYLPLEDKEVRSMVTKMHDRTVFHFFFFSLKGTAVTP